MLVHMPVRDETEPLVEVQTLISGIENDGAPGGVGEQCVHQRASYAHSLVLPGHDNHAGRSVTIAIGPPKRRTREEPVDLHREAAPQIECEFPVLEPVRPLQGTRKLQRLRQMVSTQDDRTGSAEGLVGLKSSHASVLLPLLIKGCLRQKYLSQAISRRRLFRRENHTVGMYRGTIIATYQTST